MFKALKILERAEKRGRARAIGFGTKKQPYTCPVCNSRRSVHGRYAYPIRRGGWWYYECGRRWHPEHGWSGPLEYHCLEIRQLFALLKITDESEVKTLKQAREVADDAIDYKHLLEYKQRPKGRRRRRTK
jgi:hypothetical protein